MKTMLDLRLRGLTKWEANDIRYAMTDEVVYYDYDENTAYISLEFDDLAHAKVRAEDYMKYSVISEFVDSAVITHGNQAVQLVGNHVFFRK